MQIYTQAHTLRDKADTLSCYQELNLKKKKYRHVFIALSFQICYFF